MYAHPIYVDGDYPPVLKMFMAEKLPTITEEEKKAVLENTKHYQDNWKKYSKSIF